jgi:MoaA/NifB/PqqE/SkfB family radical SAM enzyme
MKLKNPEIRFETTNKCAYHCKVCPRELMTRDEGVMSMDLFKKIIDDAIPLGLTTVTLTGFGEAMLDKHFSERVEYCKKKNLFVSMDTTGYLLKDRIIDDLIKFKFDFIRFSVFATTREVYKEVHNLDTFDLALKRINKLIDEKKKNNSLYPKTGVYFVIQKENQDQINDFIKYWENRVDEVDVWKSHNWIDTYDLRKKTEMRKKTCGRPKSGPLQIRWNG